MMTTTNTRGAGPSRQTAPAPRIETMMQSSTTELASAPPYSIPDGGDVLDAAYRLLLKIGQRHAEEPAITLAGTPWAALATAASAGGAR